MHFLTAQQAATLTNQTNAAAQAGVVSNLKSALERIENTALIGKDTVFFEGYGPMVNLPNLITALQQLGYQVDDVSNQPSGQSGSLMLDRSIKVSW